MELQSFPTNFIFMFLVLAISSFFTFLFFKSAKKKRSVPHLPPGPPGWPVVGNLFQVANSGKQFFEYVRDLLPEYGPIFTLRMGSRTMIIVTSADLAHEALVEKSQIFASRPPENPTRSVFSSNKFTVNASSYGPVWRALRKNMVQNALSSSKLKDFKDLRDAAMDKLIEKINSEGKDNEGVVSVLKNVRFAVFCILLSMCFGVEMTEEEIEKIDNMMKMVLITLNPRIDDFLPILRPFFSKHWKQVMEVRKQQVAMLVPLIQKRRAILQDGVTYDQKVAPFSYLDTLFNLRVEGRDKAGPTDPEIVSLCSEFINGGTDTTATALEWGIARLIENPEMQAKLYNEIKTLVGPKRVSEKDIDNLPYLQSFVKELLRKHPPTYFALTHAVTEPTKLAGYDIPFGCNVEFFLPAISEDSKLWHEPNKFDPDRFMSGKEDADITGVTRVKMMPFGAGRRICPGLGMGTIHVHLMLARMVQEFEWCEYPEESKVDFSEKFEFTVVMKNPLKAKIKTRSYD